MQAAPAQQYQQQQYQQQQYQQQQYQQQQYEQPLYQSTLLPQESVQQQEVRYQQPPPPLPAPQGTCGGYCDRYPGQGHPPEQCSIQRYPTAQSPGYHPDQSSLHGYPQPQPARQTYPMAQSPQYAGGQQTPPGQTPPYSQPQMAYAQGPQGQQPPANSEIEVASCVAPTLQVEKRKRPSMSCSCVKNRTRNTNLGPGGRKRGLAEQPDLPIADTYTCTRPPRPAEVVPVQKEQLRCNCHEKKRTDCFCKAPVKPNAKPQKDAPPPPPPPTHAFVGCGQPYQGPMNYQGAAASRNKCGHCSTKKKCAIQ
ncbi:altered inheritance of mitochondria protein 3 isoform X2 [Drosophila obscura]|nr:altered inheritance of mitochondria protein 3 isoform X2 [Drosophila obscura]